ncbi:MAG TPA: hypothetical protein VK486_14455 [Thermoleophilaceae bacterium]|nr:hypothetical protein [Thermoleophilaceae bacterium]
MGPPALTETTIRYLFATSWLPCDPKGYTVAVPGGTTTAIDTGGNLLHIAMWNLRRQGLMEFEQLRPVEKERVRVLGGKSFAAFRLVDSSARLPGLEGALLDAARTVGDADGGVRALVRALELDNRSPWGTVCNHCFAEASAAGLVATKGRLFRKVVVTDQAAVESLRERHDELRAARGAYLDAEPDLTNAAMADCLRTVADAYQPSLGG